MSNGNSEQPVPPKRVTVDGETVDNHSIADQIKWLDREKSKTLPAGPFARALHKPGGANRP